MAGRAPCQTAAVAGVQEVDRQRVVEELQLRAAQGRITAGELADRVHRARSVITQAGLEGILLDLPGGDPSSHRPWAEPGAGPEPAPDPTPAPVPGGAADPRWASEPRGSRPSAGGWTQLAGVAAVAFLLLVVFGVTAAQVAGRSDEPDVGTASPATTAAPEPESEPEATTSTEASTTTTTAPEGPPPTRVDSTPVVLAVGTDVQPGVYTADPPGRNCHWQRFQAPATGGPDQVVAEDASARPLIEVTPTDTRVRLRSCGPLVPYVAPATPATSVGDGDWLVGQDIPSGHYRVTAPDTQGAPSCAWARYRGFGYAEADRLDGGSFWGANPTDVDLAAGERFSSSGCGTWALQP